MWLLADVDTGVIAQYNETKKQLWSLFRQRDWQAFLDKNAPLWWLEARRSQEEWRFSRWQT